MQAVCERAVQEKHDGEMPDTALGLVFPEGRNPKSRTGVGKAVNEA